MSGSKKRKPYTHLACQACKDKHLKCDGVKPTCGNCISKRSECHYREERNRRRDSSHPHLQKLEEDLRDHIFNLERQVDLWKQKYLSLKEIARAANVPVALDTTGRLNEEMTGRELQEVYLARRPRGLMPQDAIYGIPSEGDLQYGDPRMAEEVPIPMEAAMHRGLFMYEEFPPGLMPPPPPHEYAHLPGMNEHPFFHNRPQQVQFPLYVPHKSNTPVSLHGAFSAPDLEVRQASTAGNVPNFDTVHPFSFEEMKPFPASGSSPAVFGNRYSEPKPLEAPSSFDPRLFSSLVDSKPAEMYNPDPETVTRYPDLSRSPRFPDHSGGQFPNSDGVRYPGTNMRYSDQTIEGQYSESPSPGSRVYGTQPPEPGDAQYPPDPGTEGQFAEPGNHTHFPEPGASPQYGESSQYSNPTPFSNDSGLEGTQNYSMMSGRAPQSSNNGGTKGGE